MKLKVYATPHAVRRIRTRTGTPLHISRVQMMKTVLSRLSGRDAEITTAVSKGKPLMIEGEAFFLSRMFGEDGEALMLRSYWCDEPAGFRRLKHHVKRFLLRHLNNW